MAVGANEEFPESRSTATIHRIVRPGETLDQRKEREHPESHRVRLSFGQNAPVLFDARLEISSLYVGIAPECHLEQARLDPRGVHFLDLVR